MRRGSKIDLLKLDIMVQCERSTTSNGLMSSKELVMNQLPIGRSIQIRMNYLSLILEYVERISHNCVLLQQRNSIISIQPADEGVLSHRVFVLFLTSEIHIASSNGGASK